MFSRMKIAACILLLPTICIADSPSCGGSHKNTTFTQSTIAPIIKQHANWLAEQPRSKQNQTNLCSTYLSGLNLSSLILDHINLAGSDLSETTLDNASLKHANLYKAYFRAAHAHGVQFYGANLYNADFEYSQLQKSDLQQADLQHASFLFSKAQNTIFRGANLQFANFTGADLRDADLSYTDLRHANLSEANLAGANLAHANLTDSNMTQANLNRVNFSDADLTNTNMVSTMMNDTNFNGANLRSALFQPRFESGSPNLIGLSHSLHFNTVHFSDIKEGAASLNNLRIQYKKINVRSMERTLTAIIKRENMYANWQRGGWGRLESTFSYTLFYLTCDFGAAPGRPLLLVFILIFLFAFAYRYALSYPSRFSSIFVTWNPKRFYRWQTAHVRHDDKRLTKTLQKKVKSHWLEKCHEQRHLISTALFFSFLCAFSIGWRDLNVRNFLVRLQKREFLMDSRGWVRMLAGSQSIISVYLMVLWILTYFGRPFEW